MQSAIVIAWWDHLSSDQRNLVQQITVAADCSEHVFSPDDPESSAIGFFDDDWEKVWTDDWESDWREYLTEHPETLMMTVKIRSGD